MVDSEHSPGAEEPDEEDEFALFRQAVADVRRLTDDQADTGKRRPPPRPLQLEADEQQVIDELLHAPVDLVGLETGDELNYCRPGVQRRVMQRLRRGHYKPTAHLDLHGHTLQLAYTELKAFLHNCRQREIRCVRIVHGKGRGSQRGVSVLKAAIDRWLRLRDDILAYSSAPSFDGGTGAIYVLLRKSSDW